MDTNEKESRAIREGLKRLENLDPLAPKEKWWVRFSRLLRNWTIQLQATNHYAIRWVKLQPKLAWRKLKRSKRATPVPPHAPVIASVTVPSPPPTPPAAAPATTPAAPRRTRRTTTATPATAVATPATPASTPVSNGARSLLNRLPIGIALAIIAVNVAKNFGGTATFTLFVIGAVIFVGFLAFKAITSQKRWTWGFATVAVLILALGIGYKWPKRSLAPTQASNAPATSPATAPVAQPAASVEIADTTVDDVVRPDHPVEGVMNRGEKVDWWEKKVDGTWALPEDVSRLDSHVVWRGENKVRVFTTKPGVDSVEIRIRVYPL